MKTDKLIELEALLVKVNNSIRMEFRDENARKEFNIWVFESSKDSYKSGVAMFAIHFAKYMQYLINDGRNFNAVAFEAEGLADLELITMSMKETAFKMLEKTWKYGEELKIWNCLRGGE